MGKEDARDILARVFPRKHVDSMLKYFIDGVKEYKNTNWEGVGFKAGKFVEAVTKCLLLYCGQSLPRARQFKASNSLESLRQLSSSYSEVVRIIIPKATLFIYDIASNRGGRHDTDDIDANEMDAKAVIPLMSWVVAEMIRFSSPKMTNPADASILVESLSEKTYPSFEEIDGRTYVNLDRTKISAREIGLLLLYFNYPRRIEKQKLIDAIKRHGVKKHAAEVAVDRIKYLVDDQDGAWKLRGLGRQQAESLLVKYSNAVTH